jgi:hypothetical protein
MPPTELRYRRAADAFAPEGEAPQATSLRGQIREFLQTSGLERTESWVQRVSRDYARLAIPGTPVGVFIATRIALNPVERRRLAERADLRYLLSYADPTGETAVRNIMRDRGQR